MIQVCPTCGQKNRIRAGHLASKVRCASCKTLLAPVSAPLETDPELFADVLGAATVPVLVDFWAAWCGPCRMAAPEVSKVAAAMAGRALVLKVDTERFPELAAQYGVQGIPNFIVLKAGRLVRQQAGLASAQQMQSWLESAGA